MASKWSHLTAVICSKSFLFIDDCTALSAPSLPNVVLKWLPAKTKSKLLPLAKFHYRKEVVRHIISAIEESKDPVINVL